jgi:hypothetical protein
MKQRFLLSFLLLAQMAFGQATKLTKVPGTKCSLIPPAGFVAATTFSGFQHIETGASIMINELPAPYESIVDGFTADALLTRSMTLISKETIDFNSAKATLIKVKQPANGTTYIKQMLIFGDTKSTILVNGTYPEASKNIEPKIKEAMLSSVYNPSQDDNAIDAASFTVDIKDTDLKLVKYISGSLLYSTDGKKPDEKATLIVANSLSKVPSQNQQKYAEERLKKHPRGEFFVIKENKEITIDNLKGYEIVADSKTKDGKPELVYQVMLFNDKGDYYIIVGQAKEEYQKNLDAFKKVAKTFKRKQAKVQIN